uniref:Uncharacterized protein n=1 Tax=Trichobilharzia regenti TaxID=157069 RepID=A0AA85KI62_TRIRE|nr:unnamed protein product [Trichobilharzia regenti]
MFQRQRTEMDQKQVSAGVPKSLKCNTRASVSTQINLHSIPVVLEEYIIEGFNLNNSPSSPFVFTDNLPRSVWRQQSYNWE